MAPTSEEVTGTTSLTIKVSPETYQTMVLAAADHGVPVEVFAAMAVTLFASQEWKMLQLDRQMREEDDPDEDPLPPRPHWDPKSED